jgi:hypothetical protein
MPASAPYEEPGPRPGTQLIRDAAEGLPRERLNEVALDRLRSIVAGSRSAAPRLEQLLRDHTGLRIIVALVWPGSIPRSERKAVRVVDRRATAG